MGDLPVTIRLLDPPLHEFLPHEVDDFHEVAKSLNISIDDLKQRVADLIETNPMLGHRGCRLAITYLKYLKCKRRRYLKQVLKFIVQKNNLYALR